MWTAGHHKKAKDFLRTELQAVLLRPVIPSSLVPSCHRAHSDKPAAGWLSCMNKLPVAAKLIITVSKTDHSLPTSSYFLYSISLPLMVFCIKLCFLFMFLLLFHTCLYTFNAKYQSFFYSSPKVSWFKVIITLSFHCSSVYHQLPSPEVGYLPTKLSKSWPQQCF